jgi:hypothetical protein
MSLLIWTSTIPTSLISSTCGATNTSSLHLLVLLYHNIYNNPTSDNELLTIHTQRYIGTLLCCDMMSFPVCERKIQGFEGLNQS